MSIRGKKVAFLVTDGFEESELAEPKKALDQEGVETAIVAPKSGTVKAWRERNWGDDYKVDVSLDSARADDFDALVLPGGVMSPDKLRMNEKAVEFIARFYSSGKPIAAICHGPWTLIEANGVRGRKMTSYRSLKSDLENAGAEWLDQEVVVDRGLVTSRSPKDLPAFISKMKEEIGEGVHGGR